MFSTGRKVSSNELMEGVLMKLKQLGTKGERVLELLQQVDKTKLLSESEVIADESVKTTTPATTDADDDDDDDAPVVTTPADTLLSQIISDAAASTRPPVQKSMHI